MNAPVTDSDALVLAPTRVLLLGMMGVGKSSVGKALSKRTGWAYLDNDELVARAYGRPTPEVLATGGVEQLREAESRALQQAYAEPAPVVAGVAAGTAAALRRRPADAVLPA